MVNFHYTKDVLKKLDRHCLYFALKTVLKYEDSLLKSMNNMVHDINIMIHEEKDYFIENELKDFLRREKFLSNQKRMVLNELKRRGEW